MKKLLLVLAIIAIPAMVLAQTTQTQKQEREARRAVRQQLFESQLMKAVTDKNFTFVAQTLQPATGSTQMVNPTANYVSVYPKFIDIMLPSQGNSWTMNPAFNLDLYVSKFTYQFNVSDGNLYVQVGFSNAMGEQPNNYTRDFTYMMHFAINLVSGGATLTVIPNYSSPITYTGTIQLQN